jgi:hypothetical protein
MNIGSVTTTGSIDSATRARIKRLLSTAAGTVPFDREFGVDITFIDNTTSAMEGALLVAYTRALKKYFSEYKIASISFTVDNKANTITPTVVIENA